MKQLFFLVLFLFQVVKTYCQDFEFSWTLEPSFYRRIEVSIKRIDDNCMLRLFNSQDTISKRILKNESDTLFKLITNAEYIVRKNHGSRLIKNYCKTEFLKDSNWIIINNDSVRFGILRSLGYCYDKDSNKYYNEIEQGYFWTDGNTYLGELKILNEKRYFSIYSAYLTHNHYLLNNFMYQLLKKYDKKTDYKGLKYIVETCDKPKVKK